MSLRDIFVLSAFFSAAASLCIKAAFLIDMDGFSDLRLISHIKTVKEEGYEKDTQDDCQYQEDHPDIDHNKLGLFYGIFGSVRFLFSQFLQ